MKNVTGRQREMKLAMSEVFAESQENHYLLWSLDPLLKE